MSSLMVSNDLGLMMLEFAVDKLFVPKKSIFDSVIMKKTTVMFRMLDYDWTSLHPHRTDYAVYIGSNLEEEQFHGGKSIVFAIPTASLENKMNDVDIQIHVRKEVSKYFEMDSCQNVGITQVNVDDLFNGIIKELHELKELEEYLSCFHKRQPISRSLKGTYEIVDEDQQITGATITLYVRLSYFGKSIITEIDPGRGTKRGFYAQEETNESYPYQCKELKRSKLEIGCWGSSTFLPPVRSDRLTCHCDTWGADHIDDKSDDSDDDDARRSSSLEKSTKYDKGSVSQDDGGGRGKGKNGGKGKKGGSPKKEEVTTRKQGKKARGDEKDIADQQIVNGAKDKMQTASGGGKKGGDTSKAGEKIDEARSDIGSDQKRTEMPRKRKEVTQDLKDPKEHEKRDQEVSTTDETKQKQPGDSKLPNRGLLLRRRHRGNVTVGLQDKEKKICLEELPTPPITLPVPLPIQPTFCPTFDSPPHCYYLVPTNCNPPQFLPLHCSMASRIDGSYRSFEKTCATNIPEMAILSN